MRAFRRMRARRTAPSPNRTARPQRRSGSTARVPREPRRRRTRCSCACARLRRTDPHLPGARVQRRPGRPQARLHRHSMQRPRMMTETPMESSKRLVAEPRDQDVPAAPGRERPAPGRARPRHAAATTALLAAAALGLLSACNRAAEPPAPEVRPVRAITIEKRAAGETIALTGSIQAQTEINLSFRIDGRMLERLVERRRHGAAGPADRAARFAERGIGAAGRTRATHRRARAVERGAQQFHALPRPGRRERRVARVVRTGRVGAEGRGVAGRDRAVAGHARREPALAIRGSSRTWPAW